MPQLSPLVAVVQALSLAGIITTTEYLARRALAHWFPPLGAKITNDQLASAIAYLGLVGIVAWLWNISLSGQVKRLARQLLRFPREQLFWIGFGLSGACVVVVAPLDGFLDETLWSKLKFPAWESPWWFSEVWLKQWAWVLVPLSLLVVNGVVVPVAEEFLWRGIIQRTLSWSWGAPAAVCLTAALFSLKHAVVDASLSRLLFITALGAIWGYVALRRGWQASAVLHAAMNTLATSLVILAHALGVSLSG